MNAINSARLFMRCYDVESIFADSSSLGCFQVVSHNLGCSKGKNKSTEIIFSFSNFENLEMLGKLKQAF